MPWDASASLNLSHCDDEVDHRYEQQRAKEDELHNSTAPLRRIVRTCRRCQTPAKFVGPP
ncbi:hypothetical protein SAMN04489742_3474 [Arthrobacter crystallopoietes]|uniref:Uncharacterized protein n=1 Tax=Crystallibacter crystallopoietes TaxID=37928 RepID=A0A1H1FII8_9MICC|nr:hypothetical protein SAMN04489742_3474 [Arthrobacter crystallopoietes]